MRKTLSKVPLVKPIFHYLQSSVRIIVFSREFQLFKKRSKLSKHRFDINWREKKPYLWDKTPNTGFDRHYIFHTAWAARILAKSRPVQHIDISSSLFFSAITSAFVPMTFYDYRPAELNLNNLKSGEADLLKLPFGDSNIHSLSCMHVIEHIGLGRYGEPIDPEADLKAIAELKRVLAPGGSLLFVVPVGKPKVIFNAHRIYSLSQVLEYFSDYSLEQFALIPDSPTDGGLIFNAPSELVDKQNYGCGCFLFMKPVTQFK